MAQGAVPSYQVFRGTGGILITSNPPTGNITIDGSGIFTTSGTNATIAVSTNGVLVMVAATNINFIKGSNVFLAATNIASTAHIAINAFTPVPFIEGAVTNLLLTWILPVLTVDQLTVSNLLAAPPNWSLQFNSNGVTRGSPDALFQNGVVTVGQGVEVTTGSFVLNGGTTALVAWNGLGRIRWDSDGVMKLENDAANGFNRVNFRDNTAASPALGVTNGDFIVLGGNGNFKRGGSTNKLIVPAVNIANDGAVGTPLLTLENPLSSIMWDVAIDSNPDTYFLRLGRNGDANYTMVWELGGNVGIGTTNPATRLDVNGRFRGSSNVYFPGLLSNALPVAFLAVDSGGEVFETAIPTVSASPETNAVLTNIIGTVARNVTNVVSLSTTNATSKPLTNAFANGVLTLFGVEAGANVTITPNGSNLVIAATSGGGGGGAGSLAVNDNQFVTNSLLNIKSGALTTNVQEYGAVELGHVTFSPDNTYDIGASGATRPRNVYVSGVGTFGGQITSGSSIVAGSGSALGFSGRSLFGSPSDGVMTAWDSAGASLNRFNLGGNTAAFPSLGRTNGDLLILGADGSFGAVATNRLHVPGGIVLTNANVAAGKVWTAVGGLGGGTWSNAVAGSLTASGHTNAIPFINAAGNGLDYIDNWSFGSLTNPGFGFVPKVGSSVNPHGYGGLLVYANDPMGLVTIGHPNPGSDFATFATALVISNRYNGSGTFKNDMVKIDAVMVGGGLQADSTMTRWRVWQGTGATENSSSNDVAEITIEGRMRLYGGTHYRSNTVALPTAAELGPGGYWIGVSNNAAANTLVTMWSVDGVTASIKVLAP